MKKAFQILPIFLFFIALVSLDRFFFKNNKYFCLNLISPEWKYTPQFTTNCPDLSPFFSQPYYYLAKGNQSFVFISEDRKTILKFLRLPKGIRKFALTRKTVTNAAKQIFFNYKNISEELHEETGLIYMHLNHTNVLRRKVQIIDYLGASYFLELDSVPFILQKKADPFFSDFQKLSFKKAQCVIKNVLELYGQLYSKGFIDHDPIFEKNLGLIDLQPIIFDFGQIEKCCNFPPRQEYLLQMTNSLRINLQTHSPELYQYYLETLQNM